VAVSNRTPCTCCTCPAGERQAAIKERERARRTVRRVAGEDAEEFLLMLGLIEEAQ
jgi:hypothetical protein